MTGRRKQAFNQRDAWNAGRKKVKIGAAANLD
jgi:hypothetical protein